MRKLTILFVTMLISTAAFAQDEFDNRFYFRFGYSSPSWTQFGFTESDWADGVKKKGYMGEIGTIFMLNSIPMPDGMMLGIDVDYLSVYYHQFSYHTQSINTDLGTLRLDSKVGPSFTYSPANKLAFDVYVKADLSWVTATVFVYNNDAEDTDSYGDVAILGLSTGLNVRYSVLMLGFEFNTISPKLEHIDHAGEYIGNMNDDNSDKSPLPSMNFTLGLNF